MAQPPLKRLRSVSQEAQLDCLWKVKCNLAPEITSPGSPQSNRLAIKIQNDGTCQVFMATGNSILQGQAYCREDFSYAQGLGGVHLPATSVESINAAPVGNCTPGEIQSLSLARSDAPCLCAADYFGHALLQPLDASGHCRDSSVRLTASDPVLESGWAGICAWSEGGQMHSAVAHHLGSCLTVFQDDKLLRQVGTLNRPNAIAEVHGTQGSLLALAEGHQVTLWDTRASERRGCISRMTPGGSDLPLYAVVADCTGTLIAAGGAESTAFFFDVRKAGQPIDRWPGCVKYDILAIHFPATRSDFVIVAGADQNVRCSLVNSRARKTALGSMRVTQHSTRGQKGEGGVSFRGDSRWLGLARDADKDFLACMTTSHNIIFAGLSFGDIG